MRLCFLLLVAVVYCSPLSEATKIQRTTGGTSSVHAHLLAVKARASARRAASLADDAAQAKEIQLKPNAQYSLRDWRLKYSGVGVTAGLLNDDDCERVYRLRNDMKPPGLQFHCNHPEAQCHAVEASTDIPIAVISSRRGAYVAGKVAAQAIDEASNVVFYHPDRVGANRPVFIFVNYAEFPTYSAKMAAAGRHDVRVIGCEARAANGRDAPPKPALSYFGFGFNRFCAVQFFRTLGHYPKFWMMDDNVHEVTRLPLPGGGPDALAFAHGANLALKLAKVEAALNGNIKAIGFAKGLDTIHLGGGDDATANAALATATLKPSGLSPIGKGFLEQVYVFHVANLGNVNFSPKFVLSKEDCSFSSVLKNLGHNVVRRYASANIYKYEVNNGALDPAPNWDMSSLQAPLVAAHDHPDGISVNYRARAEPHAVLVPDANIKAFVDAVSSQANFPVLTGAHGVVGNDGARGTEPWLRYGIKTVEEVMKQCTFVNARRPQVVNQFESLPHDRVTFQYDLCVRYVFKPIGQQVKDDFFVAAVGTTVLQLKTQVTAKYHVTKPEAYHIKILNGVELANGAATLGTVLHPPYAVEIYRPE